MGGIFYAAPSPGAPPFVKVGDEVTQGQIVGLIEAMKVFNEIPASTSGTVIELVAEPGQVVQIGETLLLVG
jgi:acetyl-CoA carboxylase biotin carboxyl carrier protein